MNEAALMNTMDALEAKLRIFLHFFLDRQTSQRISRKGLIKMDHLCPPLNAHFSKDFFPLDYLRLCCVSDGTMLGPNGVLPPPSNRYVSEGAIL